MMKSININKGNYEKELLYGNENILVDFWAPWCGPCKMLSPIIEEIAIEKPNLKVCKINIEEEPELAAKFKIGSIPTLMFLKEGKVVKTSVGLKPKKTILSLLE